jgi:hypothetical protein
MGLLVVYRIAVYRGTGQGEDMEMYLTIENVAATGTTLDSDDTAVCAEPGVSVEFYYRIVQTKLSKTYVPAFFPTFLWL